MANLIEGGGRLAAAGVGTLKISAGIGALTLFLWVLPQVSSIARFWSWSLVLTTLPAMVFPLTICLAIVGSALCVAGHIVRGFGQPRSRESGSTKGDADRQI